MAKKIDPKGISRAGQNGPAPKVAFRGEGVNRKEVTNIPGGTPKRNTRSPGPSGKGRSKGPKSRPESSTLSKGKLNISKPGGGLKFKSSKTGRSPRGRKSGAGA